MTTPEPRAFAAILLVAVASLLGCGSSDGGPPGSNDPDAGQALPPPDTDSGMGAETTPTPAEGGAEAAADGGSDASSDSPPESYPAFKPDMAQLVNHGGFILSAPKIVTVTWAGDPNVQAFEDFGDKIGASSYWKTAVKEYGVGPASSTASDHVHVTTAPPSPWADTAMETWLVQQVGNPTVSKWPAHDAQTIYVVYIPTTVKFTSGGMDACQSYSGYHTEVQVGTDPHVLYAVIVEACNGTASVVDAATETAAHEIGESSTDPHTNSDLGLVNFDANHLSWEMFQAQQDENGDACEFYNESYYTEGADLPYAVQRLWSNASAAAGHNPCVPVPAGPYYNVTPLATEAISVIVGSGTTVHHTRGFRIAVGATKTFQVGYYSDAPSETWQLEAVEGDGFTPPANPHLKLAVDKGTGKNGDIANVSVTVNSAPTKGQAILLTLLSNANAISHYMPLLVGVY